MIEDQVQDLPLPRRQGVERLEKQPAALVSMQCLLGRFLGCWDIGPAPVGDEPQPPKDVPSPFVCGGLADDAEEPRLERCPPIVLRLSVEHLEVDALEHLFGLHAVAEATAQRPTVVLGMAALQARPQFKCVHRLVPPESNAMLWLRGQELVASAARIYDRIISA